MNLSCMRRASGGKQRLYILGMRRRKYSSGLFDFCQTCLSLTDTSEERCNSAIGVPHLVTVVVPMHDPVNLFGQARSGFAGGFLVPTEFISLAGTCNLAEHSA